MQTAELSVTSIAAGGDGVARLPDGRVAFVAGGLPGDVVRAEFVDTGKPFVKCRLGAVVESSEHRVTPPCALAACGRCGGCPLACLSYAGQLDAKRCFLTDALVRIGKLDEALVESVVGECVASPVQWGWRNKVEFEVGQDMSGRLALGMHARGGDFVALAECKLAPSPLESAPRALAGALRYISEREDLGLLRVGLRHSNRTGSTEVALWTKPGRFPRAATANILPQSLPANHVGVSRVLVKGDGAARRVSGTESLSGRGFWREEAGGLSFAVSAPSFFQVNTPAAELLADAVLDALRPGGMDRVFDLYSGVGLFTLPLSEGAGSIVAVEMEGSSVRDLRRNLEHAGCVADVVGGDVARELGGLGHADKVVADPPRSGLGPDVVRALVDARPGTIACVSCDPATLARDVAGLVVGGYRLLRATPIDLFPQTAHVECVAVLKR